jgi:hypothetical protein
LLTSLQGGHFFIGRTFEIHCEEEWPDKQAANAGRDVLRNLHSLLIGELNYLRVVGLDFSLKLLTGCVVILRLCRSYRDRIAASAGR